MIYLRVPHPTSEASFLLKSRGELICALVTEEGEDACAKAVSAGRATENFALATAEAAAVPLKFAPKPPSGPLNYALAMAVHKIRAS